jgi:microsomal epoxide hydrolase
MSEPIERFRIEVPDTVLDDLRERLVRTRLPDQLDGADWAYGTELSYLKELLEYWREKFDWRTQEALLNRFDHFKTTIEDRALHFIHARSKHADALPIVITHGWPGSVFEFYKIIGPLSDPEAYGGRKEDAFHVVCPSMPGYGWSDPPREPGFDVTRVAQGVAALMARLGYTRYGAQGGDWGAIVTSWLGRHDPEHVCGIHLNMVVAGPPKGVENPAEGLAPHELEALQDMGRFQAEETGYQRIQGSKPQTLGYALNDSPAGLAAWIVEKFRTWSDCDGDVERCYSKDELLTNVMIYWITGSITSSTRLYYETMRSQRFGPMAEKVEVPTAGAIFPKEIIRPPRAWAEHAFDIRRWTRFEAGGHFAALEQPEALIEDVRAFYRDLR